MQVRTDELRIPFVTLLKVALFVLLVYCVVELVSLLELIFIAALLGVVMAAATAWLAVHGVRRGVGLTLVSAVAFAALLLLLFVVVPKTVSEVQVLTRSLPQIGARLTHALPGLAPYVQSVVTEMRQPPRPGNVHRWLDRGMVAGWYAVEGITAIFFVIVLAIYFVVEGKRTLAWLFSFAPEPTRRKLVRTGEEVEPVMLAYMRGQLITSTASAAVTLVTLVALRVPAAVPLAVLSFAGDFVPVVGFITATVPAVLLALTVSPFAGIVTFAAHIGYQLFENYVLTPRVYGRAMRLSTLTVLLAIAVGGALMGPIGAVLILPVAAAYPPVERIWLRGRLAPDTIDKHDAIEEDPRAADEIMQEQNGQD